MPETKTITHYENLKYPIEITEDEDAYVASIPDLPGCVAYGDTLQDAVESLRAVERLWIEGRLEAGLPIPEPTELDEYSGKFVLRISRGLHKALQREAQRQGVSLNQYVAHILAERHHLIDLERVVEEAVRKSMCAPKVPGVLDMYWDHPGKKLELELNPKSPMELSHESWGETFAAFGALVGQKQFPKHSECYYISLKTEAPHGSYWENDAPKKAKARPHS